MGDAMTIIILLIVVAAFISGGVISTLAILIIGIRSDDRARNLTSVPRTHAQAVTRRVLGVGVRDHRSRTGEP